MAASTSNNDVAPFRHFIDSRSPFLGDIQGQDAVTHAESVKQRLPPISGLSAKWNKLWSEPFKGVTTDGNALSNDRYPTDKLNLC